MWSVNVQKSDRDGKQEELGPAALLDLSSSTFRAGGSTSGVRKEEDMRTRQARQPNVDGRDDGPAHPLDLDSLPSVTLTASMVAHLLQNMEASAARPQESATSSSSSSSSAPVKRTNRKKAPSTSNEAASAADDDGPLREQQEEGELNNIYPTTTKQSKRNTTQNITADDDTASLDADGRDSAAGVTRRTCSHCGRLFKRASDCRRHERIHTNDKPHPCPIPYCGKAFVQKSALTTHLRTHTGEKPYTCRKGGCSRIFADASSRKKHESTHDKDDKRYPCPVCPKQAFRRRDTLTLHMKRMHPEVAFTSFSDGPEPELDVTSEADAYATSEMDADVDENHIHPDEESLLHFSSQPTDYSFTSGTASQLSQPPSSLPFSGSTAFQENNAFTYQHPLKRSQSAPADEQPPSSPGHTRALSAPINETVIEPSCSLADIASLFFESSGSGSISSSSQSSFSTISSNDRYATSNSSRYPFTYNAPPLLHRSLKGNNSDGENDRTSTIQNNTRPSTSSAEDLFELLCTPPVPRLKSGQLASQHHLVNHRTAPQSRQPLSRVPSFGTPWAPASPGKGQQSV